MIYTAIDTFYLTEEELLNSPSRKDSIDEQTENTLRLFGCELIQEGGILLKLPQAVMATGQVLLNRFFCKKSFARFNVKRVAASCLWLASKLEESPKKAQHILNVFNRMECRRENKPLDFLDPFSKKYEELKVDLIRTERHLLKEMGFICHVEHPHKFIINYLLQLQAPPEMMQEAWNLANDSLRTTLSTRFKSEVVACGVVYAAARRFHVSLPESPPWWKVFDAEKEDIDEVCRCLADLYRQPKATYIEVSKDPKSFVLTSRAWEPSSSCKDSVIGSVSSNGVKPEKDSTSNVDSEALLKVAVDKMQSGLLLPGSKRPYDETTGSTTNTDRSDETGRIAEEDEPFCSRNKEASDLEKKLREKVNDRPKSSEKGRERGSDSDRGHEKMPRKEQSKVHDNESHRDRESLEKGRERSSDSDRGHEKMPRKEQSKVHDNESHRDRESLEKGRERGSDSDRGHERMPRKEQSKVHDNENHRDRESLEKGTERGSDLDRGHEKMPRKDQIKIHHNENHRNRESSEKGRERGSELDRGQEKMPRKDQIKPRDSESHRDRERSTDKDNHKQPNKDAGYHEKIRHRGSNREREYYSLERDYHSSYKLTREKERHRHHPYS